MLDVVQSLTTDKDNLKKIVHVYRECRWLWTQLVVVIIWVSKIRWYNDPEVYELFNSTFAICDSKEELIYRALSWKNQKILHLLTPPGAMPDIASSKAGMTYIIDTAICEKDTQM